MALSNTLVTQLLTEYFTTGAAQFIGLHIADPTNAGLADTELSIATFANYARKPVTWSAPSNRAVVNTNVLSWTGMPIVNVGYLAIWNALTGGDLLATLNCADPLTVVQAGGAIYLPEGSIGVTLGGSPRGSLELT